MATKGTANSREPTLTSASGQNAGALRHIASGNVAGAPVMKMQIGGKEYLVNITRIPRLQAMVGIQNRSGQLTNGQMPVHAEDIPFFEVINFAISHGLRHFFREMPTEIESYRQMFKTLDYLLIDVLQGHEINDIAENIEKVVSSCIFNVILDEPRGLDKITAEAGDLAFQLLYMILTGKVNGDPRRGDTWKEEHWDNPAFRPTRMVLSNTRLWDRKTKLMLLSAYRWQFGFSCELQMCLDFCINEWRQPL